MKTITFLLLLAFCSGCGREDTAKAKEPTDNIVKFKIVIIDGCQYFNWIDRYGYGSLTHKGNCNNPIHNH